ncbi:MAG: acyltransferase [Actinomycetia bacterium]|nr:acyltransferase [Actinomycetes bacterium]
MEAPSARELAAATPTTRDRYVDLLRVVALLAVMLGHFLMTGVVVSDDGAVRVTNTLVPVPGAQPLTWLFQVMPVFFAVGGFSHATALTSLAGRGGTYADFVVSRVDRLLRPTVAFVLVGLAAGAVVEQLDRLDDRAVMVLRVVGQPLWFVGIYLAVVGFAPWMLRAHRRWGWRVLAVLAVLAVVVDVLRIGLDVPYVGYLNFAFVWLAVHQCGFWYADGVPQRGGLPFAAVLSASGFAVAGLLVAVGPYPLSMVSLPGERVSNMTPPSVTLLAFSAGLLGLALLLRGPATRWLAHRRPWTVVVAANGVAMTAFLWHFSAIVIVNGALYLAGAPVFPPVGSLRWWVLRIPLLVLVAFALAALVAVFRRFEAPRRFPVPPLPLRRAHRDGIAGLGLAVALLGVLGFSVAGFAGVLSMRTATLVVVPMSPLPSAVLLVVGTLAVRWAASARGRPPLGSGPVEQP